MARIRSVKPALRSSEIVASWPIDVRYFWVLLWGYLDDKGRGLDMPKAIAGDCFPHDDRITAATINKWLEIISTKYGDKDPPLCRYHVGGRRYIHAINWSEHQRPNRPSPSMHPPCPVHEPLSEAFSETPLSRQVLEFDSRNLTDEEVDRTGARGGRRGTAAPKRSTTHDRVAQALEAGARVEAMLDGRTP